MSLGFFKKIASVGRKIFRVGKKSRKGKDDGSSGRGQIGIFGHTKSGKTVFFSMLYETTKDRNDFALRSNDIATISEMSKSFDRLRNGDWPVPTVQEKAFSYTAVINNKICYSFESKDYAGENIDLRNDPDLLKELLEYFKKCDCVFMLIAAEDILAESSGATIADAPKMNNFRLLADSLVGNSSKNILDRPLAFVITKADMLDGFQSEDDVKLIGDKILYSKYKGFDNFTAKVLAQDSVRRHAPWQDQVRIVLQRLQPIVDHCLRMSPDLQIFFVTSTGKVREVTNEEGETVYKPAPNLKPMGLQEPFVWSVSLLMQKHWAMNTRHFRKVTMWITVILLLIVVPLNWWHFKLTSDLKEKFADEHVSLDVRGKAIENYQKSILARLFFRGSWEISTDIQNRMNLQLLIFKMDQAVRSLSFMNYNDQHKVYNENHEKMKTELNNTAQKTVRYETISQYIQDHDESWDRQFGIEVLTGKVSSSDSSAFYALIKNYLYTKKAKKEWGKRIEERLAQTNSEQRKNAFDDILRQGDFLISSGQNGFAKLQDNCKSYLSGYPVNSADPDLSGDWELVSSISQLSAAVKDNWEQVENLRKAKNTAQEKLSTKPLFLQDFNDALNKQIAELSVRTPEEVLNSIRKKSLGNYSSIYSDRFVRTLKRAETELKDQGPEAKKISDYRRAISKFLNDGLEFSIKAIDKSDDCVLSVNSNTVRFNKSIEDKFKWKPGDKIVIHETKQNGGSEVGSAVFDGDFALFDLMSGGFMIKNAQGEEVNQVEVKITGDFPKLAQ